MLHRAITILGHTYLRRQAAAKAAFRHAKPYTHGIPLQAWTENRLICPPARPPACAPVRPVLASKHARKQVFTQPSLYHSVRLSTLDWVKRGKSTWFGGSGAHVETIPSRKIRKKKEPKMPLDHKQFGSVFQAEGGHEILAVFEIGSRFCRKGEENRDSACPCSLVH